MHEAAVISIGFTKDGEHLVTGAQDGTIKACLSRLHFCKTMTCC